MGNLPFLGVFLEEKDCKSFDYVFLVESIIKLQDLGIFFEILPSPHPIHI
jgi:hypothetical protein